MTARVTRITRVTILIIPSMAVTCQKVLKKLWNNTLKS